MSLPTFPPIDPQITLDESLNMILTSIAMEELGLSHIINAEGEKIQYILGELDQEPEEIPSLDDILAVNKSVKCVLDSVAQNQMILKGKMECAVDALKGIIGPTGATGPTGSHGPAGPTGATGAAGSSGSCCVIALPGRSKQCWTTGSPLLWSHQECTGCCRLHLAPDCKKIILGGCGCYAVSFSVDLSVINKCEKSVSIGVQILDNHKRINSFISHTPIVYECDQFTVSASGIFVSTHNSASPTELMLTLLSPDTVKVNQSSICVIEV